MPSMSEYQVRLWGEKVEDPTFHVSFLSAPTSPFLTWLSILCGPPPLRYAQITQTSSRSWDRYWSDSHPTSHLVPESPDKRNKAWVQTRVLFWLPQTSTQRPHLFTICLRNMMISWATFLHCEYCHFRPPIFLFALFSILLMSSSSEHYRREIPHTRMRHL